ncbi:hypothetical protein CCHL11_05863 [Colletotrichum chlorophyti]|uniref:DNA/RNA-binding protein Alba-like domain-containing protein n=1 Tax=Colletotrichum chlorophyti TaxID=708187 RepID=A0A1Q8RMP8_9PEZI|nr:hypothetical protein CCHL11_05863 [Colletotrichum chlorophyti]
MEVMAEASAPNDRGNKKRKASINQTAERKKSKAVANAPTTPLPSHKGLLAELRSKYDVLTAFTISSTKIQKRVDWLLQHLRKDDGDPRKRAVLLHARPSEVGKMITIVEQVKRIVAAEEGGRWYQYNQMYELPPKAEVVEDTIVGGPGCDEGSDDDDFEVMDNRFERAILPRPTKRAAMSLSIFLSLAPMLELKAREGVTTQTNEPQGSAEGAAVA